MDSLVVIRSKEAADLADQLFDQGFDLVKQWKENKHAIDARDTAFQALTFFQLSDFVRRLDKR